VNAVSSLITHLPSGRPQTAHPHRQTARHSIIVWNDLTYPKMRVSQVVETLYGLKGSTKNRGSIAVHFTYIFFFHISLIIYANIIPFDVAHTHIGSYDDDIHGLHNTVSINSKGLRPETHRGRAFRTIWFIQRIIYILCLFQLFLIFFFTYSLTFYSGHLWTRHICYMGEPSQALSVPSDLQGLF